MSQPAQSQTAQPPPAGTDDETGPKPFSWRFTTPLFIGSALNPVNSSLIATALVPIAAGVHVSIGQTAALVTALYLASAIAQPTAGKVAEVFGPRRVFLAGIFLVLIGGGVGGVAQDLLTLLVSRALIGLGTSCAYPTAMLLIRRRAQQSGMSAPPGGVLGGLQIAGIATASLGLPVGGGVLRERPRRPRRAGRHPPVDPQGRAAREVRAGTPGGVPDRRGRHRRV